MGDNELYDAIAKILDSKTVNNLKKFVIIQEKNGYRVFEKYIITKSSTGFQVRKVYNDSRRSFQTLKNALTWCTLDNRNMLFESEQVSFLDNVLSGVIVSTSLLEKYVKNTKDKDKKFIYWNKLSENRLKQAKLIKELNEYSQKAKQYQMNWLNQNSYK